jgi:transglutaminase-like putative cysteine protease
MELRVHHTTTYTYAEPLDYLIQAIRLVPRDYDGLTMRSWSVSVPDRRTLPAFTDGFGNTVLTHTLSRPLDVVQITVSGVVETRDTFGITRGVDESLPPVYFLAPTELTRSSPAVEELAHAAVAGRTKDIDRLHRLMMAVADRVTLDPMRRDAHDSGADALDAGEGLPADMAHLFIAAARALGYPARTISGYLWRSDADEHPASHVWAEAHVEALGWVGFDASQRLCPTEAYVRMAIGRDYADAAPVRGVRRGGRDEELDVKVRIAAQMMAQQ